MEVNYYNEYFAVENSQWNIPENVASLTLADFAESVNTSIISLLNACQSGEKHKVHDPVSISKNHTKFYLDREKKTKKKKRKVLQLWCL